jgi:hypothetical protein
VLRITDARSGALVDAARPRRGLTRVEAHTCGSDVTNLRVLLVADTLVRALELGGTPVWVLLSGERQRAELRAGAAALGVRPFEEDPDAAAGLGEARVIHVAAEAGGTGALAGGDPAPGGILGAAPDGIRVAVAPVAQAAPDAAREPDPAALRLALLARPRNAPCRLDPAALDDAHDTLARWRRAVAGWAREPSRPVPEEVRARVRAAWEDDLDVPGVLRALRDVESDPELPDGARFETYVHADRILGLDLARDLGSPA